ncbi:MAG: aspartate kinase [Flavobacteriaceae bacterium]|jgi:hypothetical protein|nr:aspartate kinase [Flavobacteriaceae bacterium]|tara:strand:+ start:1690 stop:2349 length:660 start_codon:yes stop_codon:yes gene_type:complete
MKTIASEVTNYIKKKPFLSSALSQGIINLTSLARQIQPQIENALKKPAKSGAIVMALKRISENHEFLSTHKIVRVLKNMGDITVRSSLVDYCYKISETLLPTQAKFLNQIDLTKNIFYTTSRGVGESNIIVSQQLSAIIESIFKHEVCIEKTNDLSAISIKLPTENVTIPGIYYFIFQRLSWEGVNINEVISTSNEFTILMNEESVNTAFQVIKDLKNL